MKAKKLLALLLALTMLVSSALTITVIAADGDAVGAGSAVKLKDSKLGITADVTGILVEDSTSPVGYAITGGFDVPGTANDEIVNAALSGDKDFTVEFWVNPNALDGCFVGKGNNQFSVKMANGNLEYCVVSTTNGAATWLETVANPADAGFEAGKWNHVVINHDDIDTENVSGTNGATTQMYINGKKVADNTWVINGDATVQPNGKPKLNYSGTVNVDTGATFGIGKVAGVGNINGKISGAHVYNRVLTADEVSALYNGTADALTAEDDSVVLWYDADNFVTEETVNFLASDAKKKSGNPQITLDSVGWVGTGNSGGVEGEHSVYFEFWSENGGNYTMDLVCGTGRPAQIKIGEDTYTIVNTASINTIENVKMEKGLNEIVYTNDGKVEGGNNTWAPDFTSLRIYKQDENDKKYVLDTDKIAADEVSALIADLPETITVEDGNAIKAARAAYEALTVGQKGLVEGLAVLEAAEAAYEVAVDAQCTYVTIEAESGRLTKSAREENDGLVHSGNNTEHPTVTFKVYAPVAGEYRFKMAAACPGGFEYRTVDVNVNGTTEIDNLNPCAGAPSWSVSALGSAHDITLAAGVNTIEVVASDWFPNVDYFLIEDKGGLVQVDQHIDFNTNATYAEGTITWNTEIAVNADALLKVNGAYTGVTMANLNDAATFTDYGVYYGTSEEAVLARVNADADTATGKKASFKKDGETDVKVYTTFGAHMNDVSADTERAAMFYVEYTIDGVDYVAYSDCVAISTAE